jgi:hypothetical protein
MDAYKKKTLTGIYFTWNTLVEGKRIDKMAKKYLAKVFHVEIDNLNQMMKILFKVPPKLRLKIKNPDGWLDYIFNDLLHYKYIFMSFSRPANDFLMNFILINMFEIFWGKRTIF